MKPLKLIMTAFGPYRETETINFEALEHRSLFLITGPTGAGKTTIFDAISFAIYGEASGTIRSSDSMRSHFASSDRLTEVSLEFMLKETKYRIHRIPKQEKPKLKGEGTTEQKSDATLTIFDANPPTVIVGIKNVNEKIERVLGINAEQFKQIMMIPQGEFQKLLTAGSEDRQKILQQLFDTRMYQLLQQRLELEAKQVANSIKNQQTIRENDIKRLETDEDSTLSKLLMREEVFIEGLIEAASHQNASDLTQEQTLELHISKLRKTIEETIAQREKVREDNARLDQKSSLACELKLLKDKEESMRLLSLKLKRALEAHTIRPLQDMMHTREQEYTQKKLATSTLQDRLNLISTDFSLKQKAYDEEHTEEKFAHRDNLMKQLIQLEGYREKIDKVERVSKQLESSNQSIRELAMKQRLNHESLDLLDQQLEELNTQISKAKDAQIEVVRQERLKDQVHGNIKSLNQLHYTINQVSKSKKAYDTRALEVENFEKSLEDIRVVYRETKQMIQSQHAATLAVLLADDVPCPVCGSLNHPNPASISLVNQTPETLEELERDVSLKEANSSNMKMELAIERERYHSSVQNMKSVLSELCDQYGYHWTDLTDDDLSSRLDEELFAKQELIADITINLEANQALSDSLEALIQSVKNMQETSQLAQDQKNELMHQETEAKTLLVQQKTTLEGLLSELPEAYRCLDDLEKVIHEKQRVNEELLERQNSTKKAYELIKNSALETKARLEQMTVDLDTAKSHAQETRAKFLSALEEWKFESIEVYQKTLISKEIIDAGKGELEVYEMQLHTLEAQLKDLERQTSGKVSRSLDIFTQELDALNSEREIVSEDMARYKQRRLGNEKLLVSIESITRAIKDQEDLYRQLGHLAKIAKGDNKPRITFERYVLAAFLEDIIQAANMRLTRMSSGRYSLARTEELERSNAKGGLELEVFDNYTGRARHVKTLSGGESFKASLAMALGLSDVVQAYAGGVQLDTMFIDEGFGTLDQESLDSAINCLVDLQKTGRLVGIISHVQELKERIDTRLEVYSSATGSRTAFVL